MGFFGCPSKSDNHWWTEEEWSSKNWSEEEKFRNAALPHHLWNWRQNDRPWPMCKQYRGDNAIGPRAGLGHPKYIPAIPKLVEGRGISRWISISDVSRVEVPRFANYEDLWTVENIPCIIEFIERNPGNAKFGKIAYLPKDEFLLNYGPSSIQKYSKISYLKRDPYHISHHYMIKKREVIGMPKSETGEDIVAFYRYGCRWDSLDNYSVKKAIYLGLNWN